MKIMFIFIALAISQLAVAANCKLNLYIHGPLEDYDREIVRILASKNYQIVLNPVMTPNLIYSSIGLRSGGDMSGVKYQVVHLVASDGEEIAYHRVPVSLFSNKERKILRFLEHLPQCRREQD